MIPITDGFKGPVIGQFSQMFLRDGKLHMCVEINEEYRIRDHEGEKIMGYKILHTPLFTSDWALGKPKKYFEEDFYP